MYTSAYSSAIANAGVYLGHLRGTSLPQTPKETDSLAELGFILLTPSDSTSSPSLAVMH